MEEWTLWQEEAPVKISAWREIVADWMDSGADCSGISAVSLIQSLPLGFCGRTSLALCPATTEPTLLPCCGESQEHSQQCPMAAGGLPGFVLDQNEPQSGGCLTLNGSEFHSAAVASSLWQVLETSVDPRYFLSPKACEGILRRARKRKKTLPAQLQKALQEVSELHTETA
jgi:hypothetical protein